MGWGTSIGGLEQDAHLIQGEAGLLGRVAAEAECCSFLELSLSEDANQLVLSISAPEGAGAVAAELADAFVERSKASAEQRCDGGSVIQSD